MPHVPFVLKRIIFVWIIALPMALSSAGGIASAATVLESVRARGHVVCGTGPGQPGFAAADEAGSWSGLAVDFCRGLAAAVLGDAKAYKIRVLTANDRFKALQASEIDVLVQSTSWTLTRDTELGIRFTGVLFYDGQGFLVQRGNAVASALELSGASICALPAARGAEAVAHYFSKRRMRFDLKTSDHSDRLVKMYAAGDCTALSGDMSELAVARTKLDAPEQHMVLPELITKEPIGPAVRQGDDTWFSIVRWTHMALVAAEELGITRDNVQSMQGSPQADVRRFLGANGGSGQSLGLPADWISQLIAAVGNYGEMFDRNVGQHSHLGLKRGLNGLWVDGGLMYAVPFR